MNTEIFFNPFNSSTDDEHCASLMPSFCPEIVELLNSQRLAAKKTLSMLMPVTQDYGFDEHTHGLC